MKKTGLFLFTALAAAALTACNDSDGDYPKYNPLITTVRTLEGGDYYFQRDNGQTLYPGDKSRVSGYRPEDRTRSIIWFNLLPDIAGYDYHIALYAVEPIYTGTSLIVNDQEQIEPLGDDAVSYINSLNCNLTREWLTLYAGYPVTDTDRHRFTLILNEAQTAETGDGEYLEVELRHRADGDTQGYPHSFYLSFDLGPIADRLDGKKGIRLRFKTFRQGTEYLAFDLPAEK